MLASSTVRAVLDRVEAYNGRRVGVGGQSHTDSECRSANAGTCGGDTGGRVRDAVGHAVRRISLYGVAPFDGRDRGRGLVTIYDGRNASLGNC